ncbi:hypothetical protein E2C01_056692 [Portunus trituberculatus]|uniref:Uncharacterized protein n=1 Tax=Portunus trituberculatus TaxID=210409 RepID=A0A5B7GYX2_PORTR|nr:hypothetical protein [Portunus trituberculatus]
MPGSVEHKRFHHLGSRDNKCPCETVIRAVCHGIRPIYNSHWDSPPLKLDKRPRSSSALSTEQQLYLEHNATRCFVG